MMTYGQHKIDAKKKCFSQQLLSGFLAKFQLPRVPRQSRLLLMIRVVHGAIGSGLKKGFK